MRIVSEYSVISSIIFYNVGLIALFVMRRRTNFMTQYAVSTVLFLSILSIARLLLPIDFAGAYIIESELVIPKLIDVLNKKMGFFSITVRHILVFLWCLGTIFYIIKDVKLELKSSNFRKKYPCVHSEQVQRVSGFFDKEYSILVSPLVSQPYTVGIIKPKIYLPLISLTDEELYFVLMHEIQHIKFRDNLKRLFFLIIEAIFWWNPIAHISLNEFEMLAEIQCDAKVSAQMDSNTLKKYLGTMLSLIKHFDSSSNNSLSKTTTFFAQTYSINQRFEMLLNRKNRKPKYARYLLCSVFFALFILSYFVIIQPVYEPPNVSGQVHITSNGFYIMETDSNFFLVYGGEVIEELTESDMGSAPYNEMKIIGG